MSFQSEYTTIASATVKGEPSARRKPATRRDSVLLLTGYDVERRTLTGVSPRGQETEVHISPDAIAYGVKSEDRMAAKGREMPTFFGHSIDARMKARIPADGKHFVVLHGAEVSRIIRKTVGDEKTELALVECQRIVNGGVNKNKTFEGLFSITYNSRFQNVDRIQSWSPDSQDASNKDSIDAIAKEFDRIASEYAVAQQDPATSKTGSYMPAIGAELRTVLLHDNPSVRSSIIDLSGRMERTNPVYDDVTRQIITPSVPLTGEMFKNTVDAYLKYAKSTYGENIRVEIATYTSYPVGRYNDDFDFRTVASGFSPLIQMATARSKLANDETSFVTGGNYGGWGVAMLSPDKNDQQGVLKPQNFVNQLFMNTNKKWFIHGKIKSVDGQAYDLSEGMKGDILKYSQTQNKTQNTSPAYKAPLPEKTQDYQTHPSTHNSQSAQDVPFEHVMPAQTPVLDQPAPNDAKPPKSMPIWDDEIPFENSDTADVAPNPRGQRP
jgi:hypothetical protein